MPDRPESAALLGGGVIGGGWAARLVLNGIDVRVYDPDPNAPRRIRMILENARRAYGRLTLAPLPPEGSLRYAGSVEEAVAGADFVQESAPERVELKQRLLTAASRAAPASALICSSTSGLRPSVLQEQLERPERMLVGHPFNPVYLVPLVELCGGERTAPDAVARAAAVYRSVGMHPVVLQTEIDGFLADRLLEALWREALWLVHDDVANVGELDDVIRYGAGLRWAFMGTFLTYRMAGGEEGLRHFLEQFGPTLEAPWTKLDDVPELTPAFLEKLAAQSDEQAQGASIAELERARDDSLVAILQALRAQGSGAGLVLAEWERELMRTRPAADPLADGSAGAPLELIHRDVPAEWIDYNGHVHESRYLQLFGDATDALLVLLGVDGDYLDGGHSYYTVESHIAHLGELHAGERVHVTTQLLGFDKKRLHLFHVLSRDGAELATAEQMLLHVDTATARSAPVGEPVQARLAALAETQRGLPRPERAGRRIELPGGSEISSLTPTSTDI